MLGILNEEKSIRKFFLGKLGFGNLKVRERKLGKKYIKKNFIRNFRLGKIN